MPSKTIDRHRSIANGSGGDVRLAAETVNEIMLYREALFRVAPSYQGGPSVDGGALADALGLTFPIKVPELEAKAKDEKMDPDVLWPWLAKMRAGRTCVKAS
jgi:hypothetical protein